MKCLILDNKYVSGCAVRLFRCSMHGFTSNNKAVLLYCIFNHFNNHNHIGVATLRGRGAAVPSRYRAVGTVTQINEVHRITVKQVVYDNFMKQIRTVRHNLNAAGTENYRVQLAVPPSTNNDHNNSIFKKS